MYIGEQYCQLLMKIAMVEWGGKQHQIRQSHHDDHDVPAYAVVRLTDFVASHWKRRLEL